MSTSTSRPLRVGVAAFGTDGARSGIGSYLRQWLGAVDQSSESLDLDVLAPRSEMSDLVPADVHCRRTAVSDSLRAPMRSMAWHQLALPMRSTGWDVAFLPAANRRLPAWLPCPTVGTVHDMAMARVKGKYDAVHAAYFQTLLPALIRRLTRVVTVSECSKRDIVEIAQVEPERIDVVPHGVDHDRFHAVDDAASREIRETLGVRAPYLLYVARLEHPGKNHVALIRAFDRMKARIGAPHRLVLAGAPWNGAEAIHSEASRARFANDIQFTGFTASDALPALYRGAAGYVFPSLYEGFGMPLLEAMASGAPIACSNTSSLPEVAGDAALYFDPHDDDAIARALETLVADQALREDLVRKGFARAARCTWRASVERTIESFHHAMRSAA